MVNAEYDRQYAASPFYRWSVPALSDANPVNMSWETQDTTSKKYLPFNSMRITNNGADDVIVYPNQDLTWAVQVPKGTIIVIDKNAIPAVSSIAIKRGGTTTILADTVIIECWREAVTPESAFQKLHRRFFGG